jgi:hypothetical protein
MFMDIDMDMDIRIDMFSNVYIYIDVDLNMFLRKRCRCSWGLLPLKTGNPIPTASTKNTPSQRVSLYDLFPKSLPGKYIHKKNCIDECSTVFMS